MESQRLTPARGAAGGFVRVAAHRVTLAPGERSSEPHAESTEEELVLVVAGEGHVWLDGWLYPVSRGWAAGFPAGTGLGHAFLNTSSAPLELLVAGQATRPDNRCAWSIRLARGQAPDPDQQAIWWPDPPARPLGPHNGQVHVAHLGGTPPDCLVDALALPPRTGGHYPGDSETFTRGVRLSTTFGFKALGVWLDRLSPGFRSCWPHVHLLEEELVVLLEGTLSVWTDGTAQTLRAGEHVAFTPGTGPAHCLINDSEAECLMLVLGEAGDENGDIAGEQLCYPMHPTRNEELRRNGNLLAAACERPRGPHPGLPTRWPREGHLRLVERAPSLGLLERAADYFERVEGLAPDLATVTEISAPFAPPAHWPHPAPLKEVFVVEEAGREVGLVDLLHGYPRPGVSVIGLMVLGGDERGAGRGRRLEALVADYCKRAHRSTRLRLGVASTNEDAAGFWARLGYEATGEQSEHAGRAQRSTVTVYERPIP